MSLYALDTDTVTLLRRRNPDVLSRAGSVAPSDLATTVITLEEQVSGWYTFIRSAKRPSDIERGYRELAEAVQFFGTVRLLLYGQAAIARYESLLKQKLNVRKNDLRIAAIALEAGAVVVTRNVRDFGRVPNLAVEDWTQPAAP